MRNVLILVIAHNLQIVLRGITEEYASANQAILEIHMELLALQVSHTKVGFIKENLC